MRRLIIIVTLTALVVGGSSSVLGAQSPDTPAVSRPDKTLLWSGVALMAGGALVEVLGWTTAANKTATCTGYGVGYYSSAFCTETSAPNVGVVVAGAGLVIAGSVLAALGLPKKHAPTITIQRHGLRIERRIRF